MECDWKKEEEFEISVAAATSLVDLKRLADAKIERGEDSSIGELLCNLARIISQAVSISLGEPLLSAKKWCSDGNVIQNVDDWLNLAYTIDVTKAIRKVIHLFRKSARLGCQASYYHMSELGRILENYYSSSNVDYDAGETPPLEFSLYNEYHSLHRRSFDKALALDEPHALYCVAFDLLPEQYNCHFDDKARADMLLRSAAAGYPPAVFEYALKIRETRPKEAEEMIASVSWSRRVRSLRAWHEREEREELEDQSEFHDEEPEPKLSDCYDDLVELELNTRGDGFD